MNIYVYYRVLQDDAATRAAMNGCLREMTAATGIKGRLMVRCDDPLTWMEIYEAVTDAAGFEDALDAVFLRAGAARLLREGRRHIERFVMLEGDQRD